MKTVIFFSLMMISAGSFAQLIKIDTTNFIRAGVVEPTLDASIKSQLEPFTDKDDAVLYFYRMPNVVGGAVKWPTNIDDKYIAKLGQKQYIVAHINTTKKSHYITSSDFRFNYVGFKPNTYYKIRVKGFSYVADYFNAVAFNEIKSCKKIVTSAK